MEKKERMLKYLESIYVPKHHADDYTKLIQFISDHHLRDIEKADEYKTGVDMILIRTLGRGARETFQGWELVKADFDRVYSTYANAYIYVPGSRGTPQRVFRNSNKIAVVF